METLFLIVLNRSMTAGWLILAVIALRLLLKKAPRWMSCMLWALVAIRLICPISMESAWSLVPAREPILEQRLAGPQLMGNTDMQEADLPVGEAMKDSSQEETAVLMNREDTWIETISLLWLLGAGVLIGSSLVSYIRLHRCIGASICTKESVFICDSIDTPFILGVIRPRIYLPSRMEEAQREYVIAHEEAHIKRYDHWWKLIGFCLLTVYWFHPLCWAAYLLLGKDIELACDERVVKEKDLAYKKSYANALLTCSIRRRRITACPLAFGEVGVRERVKRILHHKKPAFWVTLLSAVACAIIAICFLTNPATEEIPDDGDRVSEGEAAKEGGPVGKDVTADGMDASQEELLLQTLTDWAAAFVNRDGEGIVRLASEELAEELFDKELLMEAEGAYHFGFSSPWPWEEDSDYSIAAYDDAEAEIYYYAHTSDPHITYWKETLSYAWDGTQYVITDETLKYFDKISSGAEFEEAYRGQLDKTMIDYTANQLGEVLNDNALQSENAAYRALFAPESAAVFLLNLSDDPGAVQITRRAIETEGLVGLDITFLEDQITETISMLQPYGADGIWVPVNFRADVVARFSMVDWSEVEQLSYIGNGNDLSHVICIGEIPEQAIRMYGYNDEEIQGCGVAIQIGDDVNYFDWVYTTPRLVMPKLYWDEESRQLQVALHTNTGTGAASEELYVLQQYDTGTLQPYHFGDKQYHAVLEERIQYSFDEAKQLLTLVDTVTRETLAELSVAKGRVTGLELGEISGFTLGQTILLSVETGYYLDDSPVAEYEGMPTLEFEVVMDWTEDDKISFDLR